MADVIPSGDIAIKYKKYIGVKIKHRRNKQCHSPDFVSIDQRKSKRFDNFAPTFIPEFNRLRKFGDWFRVKSEILNYKCPLTNERVSSKPIRRGERSISGRLSCMAALKVSNEKYHYSSKSLWIAV